MRLSPFAFLFAAMLLLAPSLGHAQFFRGKNPSANPSANLQRQALASSVDPEITSPVPSTENQADIGQSSDGAVTISDIKVTGTQRIEAATVLSYLTLVAGQEATPAKLNESLKALYATGFFSDIKIGMNGSVLEIAATENPVINRVVFEGNTSIDSDDLLKEVQLRPRQVYTKTKVKIDTKRILDVYRRSGRFAALVEPKIINLEQNRVDLVFEVTEGERTGVRRINFIGNTVFDDSELRDAVNTRESAWWKVFASSDFYDPDRLNFDRELLRRFYLNNGYADFRVLSANAELAPDRKDFFITFTVEEGERYAFGKVDVTTNLKNIDLGALKAKVTAVSGDAYSSEKVEKSVAVLTSTIADLQYSFAQVRPTVKQNKEKRTIDINLVVDEGPRVYVQRINIKGNDRTLDRVIRRQMQLSEGDPFLLSNMKKSEQKIRDLGFFEKVKVTQEEGTQPDQAVVNIDIEEKSTGEISIGAGFSSTDGALVDFSVGERNLLGKGQNLRFGIQASARTQQYDISFTEPYFMEKDLAVGFDLFRVTRDNQDTSSFDEARTGGSLRAGYGLSQHTRQLWTYTLNRTEITGVPATASRFVREQEGSTLTSMIGHELMWDQRDSKLDPKEGFYVRMNNDFAGLGGTTRYVRNRLSTAYFMPVIDKWTLTLGAEAGHIFGVGQDVRINDRFYLGGDTLRGFTFAGVGPRDLTAGADDALGGNRMARARAELSFPTGLPDEFGLRGRVFTDAGYLDDVDITPRVGDVIKLDGSLRASAGAGLTWASPFGPIGVDFALPLKKEPYDKTEFFRFSFGTRF